jgi:hypothetical protein
MVVESLMPSACLFSAAFENKRRYNVRLFISLQPLDNAAVRGDTSFARLSSVAELF